MEKKVIIVFVCMFAVKFISSCCADQGTFEVYYSEIYSRLLTVENNSFSEIDQNTSVEKLDFALSIDLKEDLNQIASDFKQLKGFGFQKSYATSCPEGKFIYLENISFIKINQINSNGNSEDVTLNFKVRNVMDELISIVDYVDSFDKGLSSLVFYLKDENNIENAVNFGIEITFTPTKILTHTTEKVLFN